MARALLCSSPTGSTPAKTSPHKPITEGTATMKTNTRSLRRNTEGLSTVEYVILLMLIAVVGIVAWRTFGNTVASKINNGNSQVSGLGGA